jgi:threonine/homoserine/homoserine lactone efflux protein
VIPIDRLLTFAFTALLIILIPGPAVLFILGTALSSGRRSAMVSAVGQEAGGFVLVIAVAVGIGSLMERSVLLFTMVKLAGAAYLIVLGVQAIRHRKAPAGAAPAAHVNRFKALRHGFVVGVTNPKGAVFFAAVLPQFIDRPTGHIPLQILVLGTVFVLIALVADMMWSLIGDRARAWFARSDKRREMLGGAGGVAMISLGVGVALTGAKD